MSDEELRDSLLDGKGIEIRELVDYRPNWIFNLPSSGKQKHIQSVMQAPSESFPRYQKQSFKKRFDAMFHSIAGGGPTRVFAGKRSR